MNQNEENKPAGAFALATGYATVEVALAWAEGSRVLSRDEYETLQGKEGFENDRADRKASIILAAEVRRLRAVNIGLRHALEELRDGPCACDWREQTVDRALGSHNDEAERRAQGKDSNV